MLQMLADSITQSHLQQSPDGVEVTDSDQAELIITPIKSLEVIKSVETTDNNGDNIIGGDIFWSIPSRL